MANGKDTVEGRFPYHVQVGCCSGALIAPDIVITAGHDMPPLDVATRMKVTVGAYHTDPTVNQEEATVRAVKHAFFHPNYTVIHNDFAIMVLEKSAVNNASSSTIVRINRNNKTPRPKEEVTILGTGTFNLSTTLRSTVLQKGTSQYLPTEECRKAYDFRRGISYGGDFLDETNLCTFGGADGCIFDSGAPIILTSNEGDLLIALVSYGVDCLDRVYPAVNARVSTVSPWIDEIVCRYSTNPPKDFNCHHSTTTGASGKKDDNDDSSDESNDKMRYSNTESHHNEQQSMEEKLGVRLFTGLSRSRMVNSSRMATLVLVGMMVGIALVVALNLKGDNQRTSVSGKEERLQLVALDSVSPSYSSMFESAQLG